MELIKDSLCLPYFHSGQCVPTLPSLHLTHLFPFFSAVGLQQNTGKSGCRKSQQYPLALFSKSIWHHTIYLSLSFPVSACTYSIFFFCPTHNFFLPLYCLFFFFSFFPPSLAAGLTEGMKLSSPNYTFNSFSSFLSYSLVVLLLPLPPV